MLETIDTTLQHLHTFKIPTHTHSLSVLPFLTLFKVSFFSFILSSKSATTLFLFSISFSLTHPLHYTPSLLRGLPLPALNITLVVHLGFFRELGQQILESPSLTFPANRGHHYHLQQHPWPRDHHQQHPLLMSKSGPSYSGLSERARPDHGAGRVTTNQHLPIILSFLFLFPLSSSSSPYFFSVWLLIIIIMIMIIIYDWSDLPPPPPFSLSLSFCSLLSFSVLLLLSLSHTCQ